MRNGASDTLFRYQGVGLSFEQLMELFVAQAAEEFGPFPDNLGDELDGDMRKINADLKKSAWEMKEASVIALEMYNRHMRSPEGDSDECRERAATEMQAYEGNEWVPLIGQALEANEWSSLAV